jgi:nucleotide-binding universal stress UspA family protein
VRIDFFLMPAGGLLISCGGALVGCCLMQTERILVPIDTARPYPEVFDRVNALGSSSDMTVILLHVLTLNIAAPENRVYERLAQEARWHLEQMARQFLHPGIATVLRVRFGKPVEQILAEAEAQKADLLMVPVARRSDGKRWSSFGERFVGRWAAGTSQRLVRRAPCPVLIVPAAPCFDWQERAGVQAHDINSAFRYLDLVSGAGVPFGLEREDLRAQTDDQNQLAA